MKRIFAIALVLLMMFAPTLPIFAEIEADASQSIQGGTADRVSGTSDIKYGVERTYILIIPPLIELAQNPAEGATDLLASARVAVENVVIAGTQKIGVTISADSQKINEGGITQWWLIDKNEASTNTAYKAYVKELNGVAVNAAPRTLVNGDTILLVDPPEGNAGTQNAASGYSIVEFQSNGTTQVGDYQDSLTFTVDVHTEGIDIIPDVATDTEAVA